MKIGDLVRNNAPKPHLDFSKTGIILELITNSNGNTVVTVCSGGKMKKWYSEYIEVINENR